MSVQWIGAQWTGAQWTGVKWSGVKWLRRRLGVVSVVACAGLGLAHEDARACENGVYSRVDEGIAWTRVTEGRLNRGKTKQVVAAVLARHPRVHKLEITHDVIANRVLRIMAVAVVRLQGDVPKAKGFPSETLEQKRENIAWAVARLRTLYDRHPDDATLRCDLGEALAAQPKHQAEAYDLLDNVEQRDLMVSAHGYLALAKLRETRHTSRPGFLAAPGSELDRLRIDLEKARSVRMNGKGVPRPLDPKDVARSRSASPPSRVRMYRQF